MKEVVLGQIKKLNVRKIWASEAAHFTPWLANEENIVILGQSLGLELEVEQIEAKVGPYSADILAKDIGTGKYVVIENQLGKTDHDHLGKAITYGSVLDASAVVWIASEFTEEHQKALDWLNEYSSDDLEFKVFLKRPERLMSVQNKMGALASQPILRNIIGQTKSTIKFNEIVAGQRILIVNLAKTRLGPEATNLLGSLILSGLQQAVMTRTAKASTKEENTDQPNFNLYITDCHNLMTRTFTTLLSENYGLNVVLANQYLGQLVKSRDTSIRDAVLGSAGSLVCFRLGLGDAEVLERHFAPDYTANDLIRLSDYQIIYKLIKNGRVDEQQKVNVLTAPAVWNNQAYLEKLIKKSRRHFGRNRSRVEEHIKHSLNFKAWLNQVGHIG